MKKRLIIVVLIVVSILQFTSCSDPEPILAHLPEGSISTENVQYNGWRNMIVADRYVFSPDGLGIQGTGKINVLTNRVTNVCLQPNCNHAAPSDPEINPEYCHIPSNCELLFAVNQEIFYTYHFFDVDFDKVERGEENNTEVIYVFASYNFVTGETQDILEITTTNFEQMYKFIHSDGYIYYNRNVAKTDRPETKEDYSLSLCRMKIGEYKEEIVLAFEDVCNLPAGVLPDPLAVDNNNIYFTCVEIGKLLEINLESKESRFYLGDGNITFATFDSPGAFYVNGYIYFTVVVPDLVGTEAEMYIVELHRVNCTTGKTEKLTEDFIRWFFVSDNHIYYGMAHNFQPTNEQLEEVGDDYSLHTIKQTDLDGKNKKSIKMQLSSPYITVLDVVGAGESLYFRAGYQDGTTADEFKIIFNLKTGIATEIGRNINE